MPKSRDELNNHEKKRLIILSVIVSLAVSTLVFALGYHLITRFESNSSETTEPNTEHVVDEKPAELDEPETDDSDIQHVAYMQGQLKETLDPKQFSTTALYDRERHTLQLTFNPDVADVFVNTSVPLTQVLVIQDVVKALSTEVAEKSYDPTLGVSLADPHELNDDPLFIYRNGELEYSYLQEIEFD